MVLSLLRPLHAGPSECLIPGGYVTDGKRLPRVVSQFKARDASVFAALEDCLTLEIRPYSSGELSAMRLHTAHTPTAD